MSVDDIIHVRHPAPVRYVPRRGAKERLGYAELVTPARIRAVEPARLEHVATFRHKTTVPPTRIYAHEGRLWARLDDYAADLRTPANIGFETLALFLEGGSFHPMTDLYRAFRQTPVIAFDPAGGEGRRKPDFEPAMARMVVEDLADFARDALKRHLDEQVLVADGNVYVRTGGPLAGHVVELTRAFDVLPYPRSSNKNLPMCRLDRVPEFWDFEKATFGPSKRDRSIWGEWEMPEDVPASLLGDEDVVLFANDAPWMALQALDSLGRIQDPDGEVAGIAAALRRWQARGVIGAIPSEECHEPLRLVRELARHPLLRTNGAPASARLDWVARYIDGYYLPRLLEHQPIADDDLDALRDIGPAI